MKNIIKFLKQYTQFFYMLKQVVHIVTTVPQKVENDWSGHTMIFRPAIIEMADWNIVQGMESLVNRNTCY
jgi:hypothetical protein